MWFWAAVDKILDRVGWRGLAELGFIDGRSISWSVRAIVCGWPWGVDVRYELASIWYRLVSRAIWCESRMDWYLCLGRVLEAHSTSCEFVFLGHPLESLQDFDSADLGGWTFARTSSGDVFVATVQSVISREVNFQSGEGRSSLQARTKKE